MKHWLTTIVLLAPTVVGLADSEFRVGKAQVDITPPVGTPRAGAYALIPSVGVIEPLMAKAIVVEQGKEKVALVALDLAYTPRPVVMEARELIARRTGIAGERVMISATHTHSGPTMTRGNLMDQITGANSPASREFTRSLPGLIAQAVVDAETDLQPAALAAVIGREEQLSFNRRFLMKDGSYSWQGPKLSKDIVQAAGPIDPEVGVLHFSTAGKAAKPLATYVNFAMHPTVISGNRFSPDYPGYLARRLADYYGPEMLSFFANGCCGNVNQNDVHWAEVQSGEAHAERIGTILAAAVFRAQPRLETQSTYPPRVRSKWVRLQRREFTAAEIDEARTIGANISDRKYSTPTKAKAVCILDTLANQEVPLEVEVQVVALSEEVAIVALPGEIFVELGLALKAASPFK
jgi:neutral ceramidase